MTPAPALTPGVNAQAAGTWDGDPSTALRARSLLAAAEPGPVGFLVLLMGGTALAAGRYLRPTGGEALGCPLKVVQLDTDPLTAPWVERHIAINMTATKLDALAANPSLFGPEAALIVQHYGRFLDPEDVENGSRTIRLLTQLCFVFHEPEILAGLRGAILDLYKQGVTAIIPLSLSSSGGGAGSALQILTARALKHPRFRARLLEGLPQEVLKTPIAFAVEPFAYALRSRDAQSNMILGNAFAFRVESAALERENAFKYVFHIGLANASGVVLDTPDEIAKVLGTSVYQFLRNWLQIKAHLVNNADTNKIFRHYRGVDTPEIVFGRRNGHPAPAAPRPPEGPATPPEPGAPGMP